MNYSEFLKNKERSVPCCGFTFSKDDMNPKLFEWQKDIVSWALKKGKAAMFEDCGLGKCHGAGTRIMMRDENGHPYFKNVEDVQVGEFLMGNDGTPRRVLSLAHGRDEMYRITLGNGDSYTCNSEHIVSCKMGEDHDGHLKGETVNIPVYDLIRKTPGELRRFYLAWKSTLDFGASESPIDSYVLGTRAPNESGLSTFESDDIIFSDKKSRTEFLAGFLDTWGERCRDGLILPMVNDRDARMMKFLCRSLGFSVREEILEGRFGYTHKIVINGDLRSIPCRTNVNFIPGYRAPENPLWYSMKIEPLGMGDYYGFTIDGNHLYMLEDFTVTHNTAQQLEFARIVSEHTEQPTLILAPLAVSRQTVNEGKKFDYSVNICRSQNDVKLGINITNYEMLEHFDLSQFGGIVLDESSILKHYNSKTRTQIIESCRGVKYKLSCTATPAPNDFMELGNQSEFLGVMNRTEMLATFFVHDGGETSKWRLKGHAEKDFWAWLAGWAVVLTTPADLGYDATGYDLPPLNIQYVEVPSDRPVASTLTERRDARRESLPDRCRAAADLIQREPDEQWLIWCDLNDEADELTRIIDGAVEVRGSDKAELKEGRLTGFTEGTVKRLVSKPSIAGLGLNWQGCHNMIFVGLSDSYEMLYQAMRRCWRFGQDKPVNVYIVTSTAEGAVRDNIDRKDEQCKKMTAEMVEHTKEILSKEIRQTVRMTEPYEPKVEMVIPKWLVTGGYAA